MAVVMTLAMVVVTVAASALLRVHQTHLRGGQERHGREGA
jgi:hypothetical protein